MSTPGCSLRKSREERLIEIEMEIVLVSNKEEEGEMGMQGTQKKRCRG